MHRVLQTLMHKILFLTYEYLSPGGVQKTTARASNTLTFSMEILSKSFV